MAHGCDRKHRPEQGKKTHTINDSIFSHIGQRSGALLFFSGAPIVQVCPAVNVLLSPAASLIKTTLTRKSLYSLYGRVLVGEVHKSIAGFEQDLVGHWQLPLPKELLQVLDGDRRT